MRSDAVAFRAAIPSLGAIITAFSQQSVSLAIQQVFSIESMLLAVGLGAYGDNCKFETTF
jgi:hypothetical protein